MFKAFRDRWAARAARVRALELQVADLERQQMTLACNMADIWSHIQSAQSVGSQVNAHLAVLANQRGFGRGPY